MGRIPQHVVDQVRDATDIVSLVGSYVPLKRSGRSLKGLCPFHQEKTPSFTVSPEKQIFYCFGCQKGGNAISFLMEIDGVPNRQACMTQVEEGMCIARQHGAREFES